MCWLRLSAWPRFKQPDASEHPCYTCTVTGPRRTAAIGLGVYALVAAFIVLWPSNDVASESLDLLESAMADLGAPTWVSRGLLGFVTNVVLFMPLSFFGSVLRPRWSWLSWGVVGLTTTLAVEGLQLFLLPDRSPAWADVVANTLGSLLGFGLAVGTRFSARD